MLPFERDGDDPGPVLGNLEECGLGEVEVLARRVAPAAVVVREGRVGRAEIGGGDHDGGGEAPFGVAGAP